MNSDLLLQVFVLPINDEGRGAIPKNFQAISNSSNYSDCCFEYYLKIFLASGISVSIVGKSEVRHFPICMLDDQSFSSLYFHSKYLILDHFKGWTDYGKYNGPSFNLLTDVPFGNRDHNISIKAQACLQYNFFEIAIFKGYSNDCFSFINVLHHRVEHNFLAVLSNIKRELEL